MRRTVVLPRFGAVVAAAAVAGAALVGCSSGADPAATNSVPKTELEKDIFDRLGKAGQTPQTVTCAQNLARKVGDSARCEVLLSGADGFGVVVTAVKVDGDTVGYTMIPAVSKQQLEQVVAKTVSPNPGAGVDSVSCRSGLDGKQGAQTRCEVTVNGVTSPRTVIVTTVAGLKMNFSVLRVLEKAQVESSLVDQIAVQLGRRPDSADCTSDLAGKIGYTTTCTVVAGAETQDFTVTVTEANGERIVFDYRPAA
ncbi:DUF4333 domain-containing protein [Mycobacterium sp. shizuoka-1]|uniref:DUF4333 domain-containing protein n=1 Tax=Mycobacterium sp. shizuoka-1 TaxID=2039281 RepID=UPI000C05E319|nr:DUF4333 domain-containing protein [Mycobacterium sp. shizuoka-1]GAY16032.1 hypothetical protein MSZK_27580 [Mycobacterium sp. shizuoka-1]